MKTTMKKGFALLIALIVVLGMFPMAVLATGESEDTTPTITSVTVSGEGVSYIPLAKTYVIAEGTTGDITITISGTNFEHWTENSSFYFKSAHSVPLSEANGWSIDTVDHTASITLGASGFSTARDPYEFGYDVTGGNDDIIGTGYYIVYGEENAPSATIIDIPENAVEITSENATPFTYEGNTASYDAELGWSGVLDSYEDTSFFELDLNAGDKVYYVLSGLSGNVGLYGLNVDNGAYKGEAHLSGSFDVEESGTYCFYTEKNVTAKAYVVRYDVSAPVIPVGKVEITDTYAGLDTSAAETFLGGGGTYTEEIGWSGVPFSENAVVYGYMAVALDKGDVLSLDASEEVTFVVVGLYTETQLDDVRSTFAEYEITETDTYLIAAFGEATMRAYVLEAPASGSVPIPEDLPENAVEITKNDTDDLPPSLVSFLGVYDAAHGWIPNVIEGESSYFAVALNAGDTVHFYFSEETEYFFGLLSGGLPSPRLSSVTASVTVDTSGVYALASKNDATVRAYVVRAEAEAVEITDTYAGMPPADIADQFSYTEAEGWHGVTLDMLAGKYLYFAVSLDKGDVLMLDFATEVTFNVAALVGDVQYGETLATSAQIEITETGNYMIIADIATTMRAYVVEAPGTGDDEGGDEGGLTEVDTFEELADAMQHSGEIRLIGDIDMGADEIDVEDGAEITLDLNGYNITATSNYP
ncbi:MAG: hypothetical protein J6R04_05060, partial [Clostridia bacterium]|nr:hypothetical protein [Clostridia bacterium]